MWKVVEVEVNGEDNKNPVKKVTLEGISKVYDCYDKKTDKLICFRNILPSGIVSYLYSLVTGQLIVESKKGLTIISESYYCTNHSQKNILGYVTHEVSNTKEEICNDGVTVYADTEFVEYIYRNEYGESMVIDENIAILNAGKGNIIVIDTKKDSRVDYNFKELANVRERLNMSNRYMDSKIIHVTYGLYFNFFDFVSRKFRYDQFLNIDLAEFKIYDHKLYFITREGKLLDEELNVLLEGYSRLKFHNKLPYVFLKAGDKHGLAKFTDGEIVIDTVYDEIVEENGEFLALKKTIDKRYIPE